MTQNLLVQRFKSAKRELTALKTTHPRGIGNLKIYKETVTFTASGGSFKDAVITVTFSQNFAAYPFVYILGYGADIDGKYYFSMKPKTINYTNNGYTAVFEAEAIYYPAWVPNKFEVYSTSPATSINYQWV